MGIFKTGKHLCSKESDNEIHSKKFHWLRKSFNHIIIAAITTGTEPISHPRKACAQR